MKLLKNILEVTIFVGILVATNLSLFPREKYIFNTEEGISGIQEIIKKNYDYSHNLYKFKLGGQGRLDYIKRIYKKNNNFFEDTYNIRVEFSKPEKYFNPSYFENKKAFSINELKLSLIPTKFYEAINLLKKKNLFNERYGYHIFDWNFESDEEGNVVQDFNIQYLRGTSGGKTNKIYYYTYIKFEIDASDNMSLVKDKDYK